MWFNTKVNMIYIPIWLDLLLLHPQELVLLSRYLHSNMVRFIIWSILPGVPNLLRFTFQYG